MQGMLNCQILFSKYKRQEVLYKIRSFWNVDIQNDSKDTSFKHFTNKMTNITAINKKDIDYMTQNKKHHLLQLIKGKFMVWIAEEFNHVGWTEHSAKTTDHAIYY